MAPKQQQSKAVRQYSTGHLFLKAKKAEKGAFSFAHQGEQPEQVPYDAQPPAIARTRSQARFLPITLPRKSPKKKKGAPAPPSPKKQPSIKVPTHYQSGWWITPFSPNRRPTGGSSSNLTDSLKTRFSPKPKKRHFSQPVEV